MASKLLKPQFEMKISLKGTTRDHSPDPSTFWGQTSRCTSPRVPNEMNLVCDHHRAPSETGVTFCNNENVTVIELCAVKIKPLPRPRVKKAMPKESSAHVFPQHNHATKIHSPSPSSRFHPSNHSRRGLRSGLTEPEHPPLMDLTHIRKKRRRLQVVIDGNEFVDEIKRMKTHANTFKTVEKTSDEYLNVSGDSSNLESGMSCSDHEIVLTPKIAQQTETLKTFIEGKDSRQTVSEQHMSGSEGLTNGADKKMTQSAPGDTSLSTNGHIETSKIPIGEEQCETLQLLEHRLNVGIVDNLMDAEVVEKYSLDSNDSGVVEKAASLTLGHENSWRSSGKEFIEKLPSDIVEAVAVHISPPRVISCNESFFNPADMITENENEIDLEGTIGSEPGTVCSVDCDKVPVFNEKILHCESETILGDKEGNVALDTDSFCSAPELSTATESQSSLDLHVTATKIPDIDHCHETEETEVPKVCSVEELKLPNLAEMKPECPELTTEPICSAIDQQENCKNLIDNTDKLSAVYESGKIEALQENKNEMQRIGLSEPEQSSSQQCSIDVSTGSTASEFTATATLVPSSFSASGTSTTNMATDVGSLKKLVPEVCACDTTTGSTDDELSAGKPCTVTIEEGSTQQIDDASELSDDVKRLKQQMLIKRNRRQWAKELTKIRVKMRERKRMVRQAGLVRARQTRRKRLEAKKAQGISSRVKFDFPKSHKSDGILNIDAAAQIADEIHQKAAVPEAAVPEDAVPEDAIPEDAVPEDAVPEDAVPEDAVPEDAVPEDAVPEDAVPGDAVPEDAVPEDTVSEDTVPEDTEEATHVSAENTLMLGSITNQCEANAIHSLAKGTDNPAKDTDTLVDNANRTTENDDYLKNLNNSSNMAFESNEIVDDEEDDGEPWPFSTSPFQPSNMPTPNSAYSQNSVHSPTPSLKDESPLNQVSNKALLTPIETESAEHSTTPTVVDISMKSSITTPHEGISEISESNCVTEINTDKHNLSSSKSMIDKYLYEDEQDSIIVLEQHEKPILAHAAATSPIGEKSSVNHRELTSALSESSPKKREIDHLQQAKMHSRSSDFQRTNSFADSLWKDMFNSDVMPLDFDDSIAAKTKKSENLLLPDVYQKSKELLQKEKEQSAGPEYVNTPCGDSYPAATASNQEVITATTLSLCSCKMHISPVGQGKRKSYSAISYCQAVDTQGNKVSNCMSRVSDKVEGRRASSKLPHMVLCKHHRKKLSQHNCCPICGLFCTGGNFIDCMSGRGHLHHTDCQVKGDDDIYLCPHCGEKSSQVPINIPLKSDADFQRTKKIFKKPNNEGIARMCIRLVTKPTVSGAGDNSNTSYDNKLFEVSKFNLLDGAAKTKLITILSSLEHLVPAMKEKLNHPRPTMTTLYDLSSFILKNDLSQLALGICQIMSQPKTDGPPILNKQFTEHDGRTLLHLAVQSHSLATVHCLVMAGVEINTSDVKGVSPLMLAAKSNQIDIVKYLIGAGSLVECGDIDGMTPLHYAAVAGNKAICEYLLREVHANIDCTDEGGWSSLVWAIDNGHSHVVKLLLNNEANIHLRDTEGNACIHWGAYSGNTEIIKLLINRGGDIEAVNDLGDRPLHIAVKQARTDAVILLLSHGADTSAINNLHQTPAECCHGACSENMKSFLMVNDALRSCKLTDVATRSSRLLHQDIAKGKEKVPIPVTNDADDSNFPTDFTYVTESVWTSPVPINTTISSLSRCQCSGDCTRASCSCARSSIACWYDYDGTLSSNFDFTNPPQLFECNKACGCWTTCSNRVVQQGITAQLELFKTRRQGWGVKARHEIPKGTFVCEYVGELITDWEADQREDDSYLFDLESKEGETYCMDAKHYGNISRFVNHRCEPNLTPVNVFIDHQDVRFPRICLFANADIEPGTELGFDYGEKFWLVKYKHFLCDCGCKTCKYNENTIADTLSQNQQQTVESKASDDAV